MFSRNISQRQKHSYSSANSSQHHTVTNQHSQHSNQSQNQSQFASTVIQNLQISKSRKQSIFSPSHKKFNQFSIQNKNISTTFKTQDQNLKQSKKSSKNQPNQSSPQSQINSSKLSQNQIKNTKFQQTINQLEQTQNYEEKYLQGQTYYQQPFNDFFRQNQIRTQNGQRKQNLSNLINRSHSDQDYQIFIDEVQTIINNEIRSMQLKQLKGNYILQHVTDDLEIQLAEYNEKTKNTSITTDELLKIRMHIQAVSKIMVFVHGKSQFRLVTSHYYIGEAYRLNGCFQQAIDHFTIALKKNTKLTQIKQTKIYHSFILTSLSQCYFQLQMYADALQILLRAYDIQQCYVNSELKINNIKTIRLISQCNLKMKNYRQAVEYMQKICIILQKLHGNNTKQYTEARFQKAVILGEQGNLLGAIEEVKAAIQLIENNQSIQNITKKVMTLQYNKKLGEFLEKFGDFESQVQSLRQMLSLLACKQLRKQMTNSFFINQTIAIKKKIIVIAIKHSNYQMALSQLEEVLILEQQKYVSSSVYIRKTLKMLGLVHLHLGNQKHAQEYFKKSDQLKKASKQAETNKKIQTLQKSPTNHSLSSFGSVLK